MNPDQTRRGRPTVLVHDYAGHPGPVDLSRELARRGYRVVHAYFAGDSGPKGEFRVQPAEAGLLAVAPLAIGRPYDKRSLVGRRFGDVAYGHRLAALIRRVAPDIVLSGNTPTEAQDFAAAASRASGAAFVHWVQDFYSIAATTLLARKLGPAGRVVGAYYRFLERRQLRRADGVVVIADHFLPRAAAWAGRSAKVSLIENWGNLAHVRPGRKANGWAQRHGLADTFAFAYTGTLALKHNPGLLVDLARHVAGRATVAVVGEGVGMEALRTAKEEGGLENLLTLPLQPLADLGSVLAAADVVVGMIEHEAGAFSVPSKVQTYLCAGRPVLLAAPATNLAARILEREGAGLVVDPLDRAALLRAADRLIADGALRERLGQNGRAYAVASYGIAGVADRFEAVFRGALERSRPGISHAAASPGLAYDTRDWA